MFSQQLSVVTKQLEELKSRLPKVQAKAASQGSSGRSTSASGLMGNAESNEFDQYDQKEVIEGDQLEDEHEDSQAEDSQEEDFSFDKAPSMQLEVEAKQLTLWNEAWEWGDRYEDDS